MFGHTDNRGNIVSNHEHQFVKLSDGLQEPHQGLHEHTIWVHMMLSGTDYIVYLHLCRNWSQQVPTPKHVNTV